MLSSGLVQSLDVCIVTAHVCYLENTPVVHYIPTHTLFLQLIHMFTQLLMTLVVQNLSVYRPCVIVHLY